LRVEKKFREGKIQPEKALSIDCEEELVAAKYERRGIYHAALKSESKHFGFSVH
jgi:hypothetical protein